MPLAPAAGTSNPRFPLFDSLRALAALSVFAFHVAFFGGLLDDRALAPYLAQLNVGVPLFFLISAFLLYRPFAQARHAGSRSPALVPYAVRRALRIYPAYWVALVIIAAALGLSQVFDPGGAVRYFALLQIYDSGTIVGGIGQAWTLAVEVSFYAVLPLWALLMRRLPARTTRGFLATELAGLALLFAAGLAWKLATLDAGAGGELRFTPEMVVLPAFLDHFALGMALAVLSVALAGRPERRGALALLDRAPWLPWALAAIAFVAAGSVGDGVGSASGEVVRHELRGLVGLGLLLPAVFGAPERGAVRRLLGRPWLLWLGLVSYGFYLYSPAIMDGLVRLGAVDTLGAAGLGLVAVPLSVAAAAASFYLLERHALRLGRRLSHRRRSQDADRRAEDLHERAAGGPMAISADVDSGS